MTDSPPAAGRGGDGAAPDLADADRIAWALATLRRCGLDDFAVAGGVALAIHLGAASGRHGALNDLDLVVPGPAALPPTLADGLLVVHAHLNARPGRMLLQLADPGTRLRVDLFGSVGDQMARAAPGPPAIGGTRVLSRADLLARLTRILLDLALGEPVAGKHARDHAALLRDGGGDAGAAWRDHRRDHHPESFEEACGAVRELVRSRGDLLVRAPPGFGRPCRACSGGRGFRPAPDARIAAVLGCL